MRQLHELDAFTLKYLMFALIKKGVTKEILNHYDVELKDFITILFKCGSCYEVTRLKIMIGDIKGITSFLCCPYCKMNSYAQNIFVERDGVHNTDILNQWF